LDEISATARLKGAEVGVDVIAAIENQTITLPIQG
jgi:hypothetical protein